MWTHGHPVNHTLSGAHGKGHFVRGCTTWSCSDLFVADADILNLIRVATNMENLEYPAISLNMENSEFCTASGKNCKKVVLVHMFV